MPVASVCHFPPYAYVEDGIVFGPWPRFLQAVLANVTWSAAAACGAPPLLAGLAAGRADVALHPMLIGQPCGGCAWSYPMQMSGLMFVSPPPADTIDATSTFGGAAWALIGAVVAAFAATASLAARRHLFEHAFCVLLTLTGNLQYPSSRHLSTHLLYGALAVFSMLVAAVYTSDLTAAVLREKAVRAPRMKQRIAAGQAFTVMEGGAQQQMAAQYPGARYGVLPYADAVRALPALVPWEVGEMLQLRSCAPLPHETGMAMRLPYGLAFAPAFPAAELARVDARIREAVLSQEMQRSMHEWLELKYRCTGARAVRISAATMRPLALAALWVYVAVVAAAAARAAVSLRRRRAGAPPPRNDGPRRV